MEDFTATTEAEMKLYVPAVTDFMIVVKRSQVGKPQPFNAVLVSDWTDQMLNCAFLITEDDGVNGNQKCSDFGNSECCFFGIKSTVLFASAEQ